MYSFELLRERERERERERGGGGRVGEGGRERGRKREREGGKEGGLSSFDLPVACFARNCNNSTCIVYSE